MDIKTTLAQRHGFDPRDPEALSMWNTAIQAVMFAKMIGAMHTFFVWVSLITLALGGIGVMNIMLVAVKERTREIGVRKAIGATSRAIQWQFLSEGLALTLSSGAIGYLVGVGLCALVNLAPMPERFSGMITTWQTAAMAIGVLTFIGVAASTYPARRAASLPPIEALGTRCRARLQPCLVAGNPKGSPYGMERRARLQPCRGGAMLLKEVILQAAAAIREHRFRAGLTMLGIAWGIVTVVILMAYGQGFRSALVVGFRNAVSDGTARLRGGQTSSQVGGERAGRRIFLKDEDVEALRQLGTVKYRQPRVPPVASARLRHAVHDGGRQGRGARVRA